MNIIMHLSTWSNLTKILKTTSALQEKIISYLHETSTATDEEDKDNILTIYNTGQRSLLKPRYHGQPSAEHRSEKAYTKFIKDSIEKPLSSKKPDDLTGIWRQRRDDRRIHMTDLMQSIYHGVKVCE